MNPALFLASLVCLAAGVALIRILPAQNVLFIMVFLAAIEAAFEYSQGRADLLEGAMFWPGVIILSRMSAQWLLKRCRKNENYGWFLLGLASVIAAIISVILESPMKAAVRFCVAAACLFVLAPWFIQKRVTASGESKK